MSNINPLFFLQEDGIWYKTKNFVHNGIRPMMNADERSEYNDRTKTIQRLEAQIAATTNPLERSRLMQELEAAIEQQKTFYKGRKFNYAEKMRVKPGFFG